MPKRGQGLFPLKEKKRIVEEAYSIPRNIRATAIKYGVQPSSQIRRWKKTMSKIPDNDRSVNWNNTNLRSRGTCPVKGADLYSEHLLPFFINERAADRAVDGTSLLHEAMRVKPGLLVGNTRALRRRIDRFVLREDLVQRRGTHQAQQTRSNTRAEDDFVKAVNSYIRMMKLSAASIVNIDETNVDFDQPATRTLNRRGERTIRIASSGSASGCTVLLGVALDGSKLPPFVVFKASRNGRVIREVTTRAQEHGFPSDCVYIVQKKAWIDKELMLEWIQRVWVPWITSKGLEFSYLIMDSFKAHLVSSVSNALNDVGTSVEFIVPGCTSTLQVLDVGVNKPFKDYTRWGFEGFLRSRESHKQKPSRVDVAKWIDVAWKNINVDTIRNTWRHIGIECNN